MRRMTIIVLGAIPAALAACASSDSLSGGGAAQPETIAEVSEALNAVAVYPGLTAVPSATPKAVGIWAPNELSRELAEIAAAEGAHKLENPANVTVADGTVLPVTYYGYSGEGPMVPATGDLQTATHKVESTKTEPDKNTYLVLDNQMGADPQYNYGTHFVYQGHENAASAPNGQKAGYITRVNLDADRAHRVTLLAATDVTGAPLSPIDGSTWDPFAQKLLFTIEGGATGGVLQASLSVPSTVQDLYGIIGRGGYEGIQNDSSGNLWIIEDVGGPTGTVNTHARQPNSFVYRFVPKDARDLTLGGKLQALQVVSLRTSQPIVFHAGAADADILSDDTKDLNTYGLAFTTHWVTIHDTDIDGTASFSANAAAKARNATPFKRPENGVFRPGSSFREFYFDATGDTNALTEAGSAFGGFGGVFKLTQSSPSATDGKLTLFFQGDVAHTGLDNVAFWDRNHVVLGEDAGDTLHTQRNALDSAFMFDVRADYAITTNAPLRILAEGRDPSATVDSALLGLPGYQNDGDNEITGIHVSNGDASFFGILGAQAPRPFHAGWRVFYTAQHGNNVLWEVISPRGEGD